MATFRSIHIRNFRAFQDFQIEDLRKFNLFVGPSEVGKTSVLEALYALSCHGAIGSLINDPLRRCALRRDRKEEQIHQASLFHNMQTEQPIELSAELDSSGKTIRLDATTKILPLDNSVALYETESEVAEKQGSFYGGYPSFDQMQTEWKLKSPHGRQIASGSSAAKITGRGTECKETSGSMDETHVRAVVCTQQDAACAVDGLQNSGRLESAVSTLRQIESSLKSIYLAKNNLVMVRLDGIERPMPIHSMGGGFLAALSILGMAGSKNNVVLADEIAANVYFVDLPALLRALLSFLKDENKQLFATTHSKSLLIALREVLNEEEALREDVVCFSLSYDKHNKMRAYPYTYDAINHCIEHDIEFR